MTRHRSFRRLAQTFLLLAAFLLQTAATAAPLPQAEQIYAMPGTLEIAQGQSFLTYFVTTDGTKYAIFGATPEVEAEITRLRDQTPGAVVKVWGDLYSQGQQYPGPEIIATAVQATEASAPSPPPPANSGPPVAVGRFDYVNLRALPDPESPVVGTLVQGQRCDMTGRNENNSWLLVRCQEVEGWVTSTVVNLEGDLSQIPVVVVAPQATPAPTPLSPPVANWRAVYYANRELQGDPVLMHDVPSVNFNWGTGSPGPTVPVDNFSARYERIIDFAPGQYRMCICNLDDGARMWIDDELVLNDWREGPARDLVVDRQLSGQRRIRIEYFEAVDAASITFTYTGSSERLNEWQTSYWNSTTLEGPAVMTRSEPRTSSTYPLDYNWGTGSPAPGVINPDIFSARWEGVFSFDAGSYAFNVISDDGVRIYVDGTLVLNGWQDGYKQQASSLYGIGQGQHRVRVDYYERTGDALVRVWWYLDQGMRVQ